MSAMASLYDQLRQRTPYKLRAYLKRQSWFFPLLEKIFGRDAYSAGYYADVQRLEESSVPYISEWIVRELQPRSVIDIGCGPGHLIQQLFDCGIDVFGVDASPEAARLVTARGLPFECIDITACTRISLAKFDLAISCEVAEHLKPEHARTFVMRMSELADIIYITAAEPLPSGGLGLYHFNEQPNQYWINLFAEQGFYCEDRLTSECRSYLMKNKVISYLAKPIIFRRGGIREFPL